MEVILKHDETGDEQAYFGINDLSIEREIITLYPKAGVDRAMYFEDHDVVQVISQLGPSTSDFVERFVQYTFLENTEVTVYTAPEYPDTNRALSKFEANEPGLYEKLTVVEPPEY